jgi:glycosyltransferase involved in cell wall biosynthesis
MDDPEIERENRPPRVAVIVPCYRVRPHLAEVLRQIGPEVTRIYCVEDGCPDRSGDVACEAAAGDPRIRVLVHPRNMGVGAAVITGYRQAMADDAEIAEGG